MQRKLVNQKIIKENIPEELKDKFINAAIHLIIDEELCSESDIERIDNRKKDARLKNQ